jgi:alpha-L-fucosidase
MITSGDGVTVTLNRVLLAEHNNPFKERSLKDVVLLSLKKGTNKLVVKFYNGFQKSSTIGIDNNVEQVIYHKTLKPITMEKGLYYSFSWQLHKPFSPHTTLSMPNVRVELIKK